MQGYLKFSVQCLRTFSGEMNRTGAPMADQRNANPQSLRNCFKGQIALFQVISEFHEPIFRLPKVKRQQQISVAYLLFYTNLV